jgi:hypothetical protein
MTTKEQLDAEIDATIIALKTLLKRRLRLAESPEEWGRLVGHFVGQMKKTVSADDLPSA